MTAPAGREFFTVRTVSEALAGFRPRRRTPVEIVALEHASGRVPAEPVRARHDLPGFARATVDGFAVRASDTYGASEGLPSYLEVAGEARMGAPADAPVTAGRALAIPTGAMLPAGADAVVMVEHTAEAMPGTIEVVRPAAPGDGLVKADEDARAGTTIAPEGRALGPHDVGMLAAAGVTEVRAYARPRVAILSTGDEVVAADTPVLGPGQVRDATAPALAALIEAAGGVADRRGIVADDAAALLDALRGARDTADVVVVSAGSSVGARDVTAAAVAALGGPGIWCHGLALRPGKPTLLAECDGVPVIGLPGNPRSALVVFRLVGLPVVRLVGGVLHPRPEPTARAVLDQDLPSAAGRLDVVQVRVRDGVATPLHGRSALLSVLAAADGHVLVPEEATGLPSGAQVTVALY